MRRLQTRGPSPAIPSPQRSRGPCCGAAGAWLLALLVGAMLAPEAAASREIDVGFLREQLHSAIAQRTGERVVEVRCPEPLLVGGGRVATCQVVVGDGAEIAVKVEESEEGGRIAWTVVDPRAFEVLPPYLDRLRTLWNRGELEAILGMLTRELREERIEVTRHQFTCLRRNHGRFLSVEEPVAGFLRSQDGAPVSGQLLVPFVFQAGKVEEVVAAFRREEGEWRIASLGIANPPPPDGNWPEAEELLPRAEQVLGRLGRGEIDEAHAEMPAAFQTWIDLEGFHQRFGWIPRVAGAFREVRSSSLEPTEDGSLSLVIEARMEERDLEATLRFERCGREWLLLGLRLHARVPL